MSDTMFNEAVQALRSGQRMRARDLLARLLKADQSNPNYWLWMSAAVDSEKEQVFCLQNALRLDPNSIAARRGLVVLGALALQEANLPPVHVLEHAPVTIPELPLGGGLEGFLSRRRNRERLTLFALGAVALVMAVAGLSALGPRLFRPRSVVVVTSTPPPSATLEPTTPPPTADRSGCGLPDAPNPATPLAAYLCVEQTPTPVPWPTDLPGVPREVYTRLKSAFLAGNWSGVIQQAEAAFDDAEVDANPRAHFYTGEAYRQTGNFTEALRAFDAALGRDGTFAPAWWGRGMTQWALARGEQAAADLGEAMAADPRFLNAYLDRGQYYLLAGQAGSAQADLEQARLIAPHDARVLAALALALAENGDLEFALEMAEEALQLDPAQPLAYYARGRAAYLLGDYDAATVDFARSYPYLLNQPNPQPQVLRATVLYHAGLAMAAAGDEAAALSLYGQGLSQNEAFGPLYQARGELHLVQGDYDAALSDLTAALEIAARGSPAQLAAYLGLAQAYEGLAQYQDAVNMYRAALRGAPAAFEALLGLGKSLLALEEYDDAIVALDEALATAGPDDQGRAMALLARAEAYAAAGQAEAAVADLLAVRALSGAAPRQTAAAQLTQLGPLPTGTATPGPSPTRTATPRRTPTATRTP